MSTIATIKTAGIQTTLQDAGRPNLRHLGVAQSGAADRISFALTNHAVGNSWDAPALECTLTGPKIIFSKATAIALGGADMEARLNSQPIELYRSYEVAKGDQLSLGAARSGARSYIAFAGGLSGEEFLSSVSTFLPGRFGGIKGRVLREADSLCTAIPPGTPQEIQDYLRPTITHDWLLRATIGPEAHAFSPQTIRSFFSKKFIANKRGDRMGQQLIGPNISTSHPLQLKSSAVYPGTVQCPQGGTPFLLLPDAQTTGGYARIAQVISADLNLTGQIRPGDQLWFTLVSEETAREIATKKSAFYNTLMPGFALD